MSIFEALLQHDHVPNFYRVENTRSAPKLEDVAAETRRVMQESGTLEQLKPGQSVCIAAGSREIANIALIVRTVCEVVREHGAEPFIIPAMGSHAGAQAEGQKKILADFGITEEYTGAPIRSSMETVQVGVTKPHGFPARIDRYAAEADWIIPIGRIKPHTDIRGPIQSGILKMIVIGMGKQFGADICHAEGFPSMSQNIVVWRSSPTRISSAVWPPWKTAITRRIASSPSLRTKFWRRKKSCCRMRRRSSSEFRMKNSIF